MSSVVDSSPLDRLLTALDQLDADAATALFASDGRLLTADGRRAEGVEAIRALLGAFLDQLRSTTHVTTAHWHQDDVWIAEVDASYELRDWLKLTDLPRVFVLRDGPRGYADVRVYGAHEQPLASHQSAADLMPIGGLWLPPL
jgi:SnoaL-like protein